MGASLTIESPQGSVPAGGELTVRLRVSNTGQVVDELTLTVIGRSASWAQITPSSVNLFPGASGEATLRFAPPRSSSVPAGVVPYAVRVTSSEDPQGVAIEEGTIEVLPYSSIRAEIVPETSYGRTEGRHEIRLINEGNAPEDLAIVASDPDQLLSLTVEPPNLRLEEGSSGLVRVRVSPANDVAREPGMSRRFSVRVADRGGQQVATLPAAFQLTRPRARSRWPVVAVVLVMAIAGLALAGPPILKQLTAGTGTPTATIPPRESSEAETSNPPSVEIVTPSSDVSSLPAEFTLPDVRNMDEASARSTLEGFCDPQPCLVVSVASMEDSAPAGTVIGTVPRAGSTVQAGSPVEVDVSTGPPARQLEFLERVAGAWTFDSWTEAGSPITLNIELLNGTMTINGPGDPESGQADWRVDIQSRGQPTTPQPAIRCGGQTTLSGMIEGVPGGGRNEEIFWTADLRSIDHGTTGENWITRALCGWNVIGERAPFNVALAGDTTNPATNMEMANQYGTFRWSRP